MELCLVCGAYWICEHRPEALSPNTIGMKPVEEAMDKSRLVSLFDTSFMGSSYNRLTGEWAEDANNGNSER